MKIILWVNSTSSKNVKNKKYILNYSKTDDLNCNNNDIKNNNDNENNNILVLKQMLKNQI